RRWFTSIDPKLVQQRCPVGCRGLIRSLVHLNPLPRIRRSPAFALGQAMTVLARTSRYLFSWPWNDGQCAF
ncbi:MAG TPA: hypothetical protein VGG61_16560, partial [Gemmataceae bacterium]